MDLKEGLLLNCGAGEDSWESSDTWKSAGRSNQLILKEINPEYLLEGLMLKLQYFGPPDMKSWLTGKDPAVGKDWGHEEKGVTEDKAVGWNY